VTLCGCVSNRRVWRCRLYGVPSVTYDLKACERCLYLCLHYVSAIYLVNKVVCDEYWALHLYDPLGVGTLTLTYNYLSCCVWWWAQVRRHGAEHDDRQGSWRSVLSEWSACHCSTGAGDSVKFQSHLPSKSADGQAKGAEGKRALYSFSSSSSST